MPRFDKGTAGLGLQGKRGSRAAALREREKQVAASQGGVEPQSDDIHVKHIDPCLARDVAKKAQEERWTLEQRQKVGKFGKLLLKKRRAVELEALGVGQNQVVQKKMKKHLEAADLSKQARNKLQTRSLIRYALDGRVVPMSDVAIWLPREMEKTRSTLLQDGLPPHAIHHKFMGLARAPASCKVFYMADGLAVDADIESMSAAQALPILYARMLGGFLGDADWVNASVDMMPIGGEMLEPLVRCQRALDKPTELVFSLKFQNSMSTAWAFMALTKLIEHSGRWVIRVERSDIRKDRHGIVLLTTKAQAKQSQKKERLIQDRIREKKRNNAVEVARLDRKLKSHRGAPMTLNMFLEHVTTYE